MIIEGTDLPSLNIDLDGDGLPDLNIDQDGDGISETNIGGAITGDETSVNFYIGFSCLTLGFISYI